jgi:hypothetical protein
MDCLYCAGNTLEPVMRDALIAILICGVAVAACENRDEAKRDANAETAVETSWDHDSENSSDGGVNIQANVEGGKVELKLPGGLEGTVKLPEGLGADAKFDLDGVGRYPGAKLTNVDVKADKVDGKGQARVQLGFTAPGSADQVADWYEAALVKKGRSVARTGTTITGTTEDGDPMVITINEGSAGVARGRITITDSG